MPLAIIGVTEAGFADLSPAVQERVGAADIVIAASRFHACLPAGPRVEDWPSPFAEVYARIETAHDRDLVILATGDPLWYGAGAAIIRHFGAENCEIISNVSGFQIAANRMGWPVASCEKLTVHGRPIAGILPYLYPRARLLLLAENASTPKAVAQLLTDAGFGAAQLTVLAHIGGDAEARFGGEAQDWIHQDVPAFHILAVDCSPCHQPAPGVVLPDTAFENSGKLTKRDARASAIAKLAPFPGAVFWDVGCGSGAVAIDFLRQAPRGTAFAIDRDPVQLAMAKRNATACGVPQLKVVQGDLPDPLASLPRPDAIFIGGGLSPDVIARCQDALRPGGALVAHAVTIESEAVLFSHWQKNSGDLARISLHHADPVGGFHGWRPLMPVTQWHWIKPVEFQG